MSQPPFRLVTLTVTLPVFLAISSQTMIAAALPAIGDAMGELARLSWLVIAYMFALTVAGPVYGSLGDMLGRRRVLMSAVAIYGLGSFLAIFAPTFEWLTVSRLFQGIGGGGLMSVSQALIGQAVEGRERGRAQGYVATISVVASSAGPVIGGGLTAVFGWQSQFVFALPLCALAAFFVWRLPLNEQTSGTRVFDYAGFVLLNAFVGSWVVALEGLKMATPSGYATAVGLGLLGVVFLFLLVRTERHAINPIFPPRLMQNADIVRAYALAVCHGAALVSFVAFVPLYMQLVRGADIYESSGALLALTVGLGLGGVLTGNLITRTGRVAIFPSISVIVAAALVATLAFVGAYLPFAMIVPMLFLNGLTMGSVMSVVHVTVQHVAPMELRGSAAGAVTFSRSMGSVLGTAMVTVVLFGVAGFLGLDTNPAAIANGPGAPDLAAARGWAIAFTWALLTIALFCLGSATAAISSRVRRIDNEKGRLEKAAP